MQAPLLSITKNTTGMGRVLGSGGAEGDLDDRNLRHWRQLLSNVSHASHDLKVQFTSTKYTGIKKDPQGVISNSGGAEGN